MEFDGILSTHLATFLVNLNIGLHFSLTMHYTVRMCIPCPRMCKYLPIYFCLALKLNAENMAMVLNKVDIKDPADVASALGLSQNFAEGIFQAGKNFFGLQSVWNDILIKWLEHESYVSWGKLAEAVREKRGVDCSQIILEISGEGRVMNALWFLQLYSFWGNGPWFNWQNSCP